MSLSAMIISSRKLTIEDFRAAVLAAGGFVNTGGKPRGTIGEGDSDIWLSLLPEDWFYEMYDSEDRLEWQNVLGDPPQSLIEIDLDHTQHSRLMYRVFFLGVAKLWPCILSDIDDALLSGDQVAQKYGC
ncbi:hypothetical protein [Pseudomonas rustica]|uniref:hypothetical protein n=1 Tax=Pseudomonas rustica TaxID=2827099 RepID=UPI001BAEDF80|nr:hypothetical protein [Pseudomonas rustica]MBS4090130.1 hypothetical protein [Pseudomonas rustica]